MNLKQLFADENAVSPVIGVILMVAITVILAAVIGTFVLGLGENVQDSAPQANFQFEYGNTDGDATDDVTITHTGGEDVDASSLTVTAGTEISWASAEGGDNTADPVATGVSVYFEYDQIGASSGDTVRVIWTSPSGGTSNTIGQSTVPS